MQNIKKYQNQRRNYFKKFYKVFPTDRYYTLNDYTDIYLKYFGTNYRKYLNEFYELLKSRGIPFISTCQVEELLWDKLKTGDYKKFKPKIQGDLDQMNGIQFEVFLSKFFTHCGYYVKTTSTTNDYGADLIMQKFNIIYVVQAKRQRKTIGIKAVQEVASAREYYKVNEAMVITTNKFSKNAIKLANAINVELWDGERLKRELKLNNFIF